MLVGLALGRIGCLLEWLLLRRSVDAALGREVSADESAISRSSRANGEMYGFRLDVDHPRRPTIEHVDIGLGRGNGWPGSRRRHHSHRRVSGRVGERRRTSPRRKSSARIKPLKLQLAAGDKRSSCRPSIRPRGVCQFIRRSSTARSTPGCWRGCLWVYYPFRRRDGEVIALLLTIHPISRFLLEIIRTDEPAVWGTGLSISQNISLLILVLAAGLWFYILRQPRRLAWAPQAST